MAGKYFKSSEIEHKNYLILEYIAQIFNKESILQVCCRQMIERTIQLKFALANKQNQIFQVMFIFSN